MFGCEVPEQRTDVEKSADCNHDSQACENYKACEEKERPKVNPKIHSLLLLMFDRWVFVGKQQGTDYHQDYRQCQHG